MLVSPTLSGRAQQAGVGTNPKYNIFSTKELRTLVPELQRFDQRWEQILGRDVQTVLLVDSTRAIHIDGWILALPPR